MSPTTLPQDFTHILQDRFFLDSLTSGSYYKTVGKEGSLGKRMLAGPLCFEYYTCDKEPELLPWKGLRFVIWIPVTREDVPQGWYQSPMKSGRPVCAYLDIRNTDVYYKSWRDTFKTYYNRFSKQTTYQVEEVSGNTFCQLYKQYGARTIAMSLNILQIEKLESFGKKITHFYFLKDIKNGEVVAGNAITDCFSAGQSYYITAFTRKDIAPKEAGLWLLNHWMKESSARGIAYANFGNIWTPGQPKSWKGFSEFKMKFNPQLIVLQKELIRCTFSLFG